MHNLFRCECGARVVCGVGDAEYDDNWNQLASDHSKMGHQILKPLKIPSNTSESFEMVVNRDADAESGDDDAYSYYDDELVS